MVSRPSRTNGSRPRRRPSRPARIPKIPTYDELRAEEEQIKPKVFFTVRNSDGEVVRRIDGKASKGIHRVTWDLRYPSARPTSLKKGDDRPFWMSDPVGPLALPGTYTVTMSSAVDGVTTDLGEPQEFEVVDLGINTFARPMIPAEVQDFQQKVWDLERAFRGAVKWASEAESRLAHTRKALYDTPNADTAMLAESQRLQTELDDILVELSGDETRENRNVFTPPSISERVNRIVRSQWDTTSAPTQTKKDGYEWAADAFSKELGRLKALASDLETFESQLEAAGAPWTPGRLPNWTKIENSEFGILNSEFGIPPAPRSFEAGGFYFGFRISDFHPHPRMDVLTFRAGGTMCTGGAWLPHWRCLASPA